LEKLVGGGAAHHRKKKPYMEFEPTTLAAQQQLS
jgi:hypothetical protein